MSRLDFVLMEMHIATEVTFEDIHGTVCAFAVPGVHPKHQSAMIKLFDDPTGVPVAEELSEQGS